MNSDGMNRMDWMKQMMKTSRKDAKAQSLAGLYPLASKSGLAVFLGLLVASGAMCPKCGHGTRAVSKRWAKCTRCGERVQRGEIGAAEAGKSGQEDSGLRGSAALRDDLKLPEVGK